jgi:hypothetical protein
VKDNWVRQMIKATARLESGPKEVLRSLAEETETTICS